MRSFGSARGQQQVVHIGPVGLKHGGVERPAIPRRAFSAMIGLHRAQQFLIQPHGHEHGGGILCRDVGARVPQVEGVVQPLDGRHIDVHEFHRMVRRIVDGVRVPHAAGGADGSLEYRRSPVDRELRLAIEDDEHLLALIVEVMAHPAAGHDLATVDEIQVGSQRIAGQQHFAGHIARTVMRAAASILAGVGVSNP